ncbi:methylated-DNA--[protein]-cysteine S-methyltransferase [Pseudomonas resinovorans]|uniref:methylated-DNA--[protein]-cysteine S-methyltransferase n=1 Tax=Metapseudomonas resinovorans TaxID=53412 RepID=UPI00237F43F3|nr:methylated-DNA--[protein]-cysteine S-methyltransferase [Pseudomonas resinovorans]MDE3735489.1 methylated-DNA--[protein]-cysteine S-methyltransferase [Pseudomonas resinovorans]
MHYRYHDSPTGPLLLAGDESGLQLLYMDNTERWQPNTGWVPAGRQLDEPCRQLDLYFEGRLKRFDLRLAPRGTPFQQRVWQALLDIPYGRTTSYSELAERIGNPKSVRAVGTANGANPISIIIPCHRVIGRDGSLTGYAGGLPRKALLLKLEGVKLQPEQDQLLLI